MKHFIRRFAMAMALLVLPLTGCEVKQIWVELPRFGDGAVDGIWLWRLDDASGEYVRHCHLPLGDVESVGGREAVYYDQECSDEFPTVDFFALVERAPDDPESATLGLWYVDSDTSGTYKLSSYGDAGESALSETTLEL